MAIEKKETDIDEVKKEDEVKNDLAPDGVDNETEKEGATKIQDSELDKWAKKVGIDLKETKKVSIKIPRSELNPHDEVVSVGINGYFFSIKRGEEVQVPEEVKNILERAVPPYI
jgi:hypothetical protein